MAGQFGCEQGHRDVAGLDRREEPGDVVQALRRENRHPLIARRDPLQACADGMHPDAELRPGQLDDLGLVGAAVVQIPVCRRRADVGDVAVDQRAERDPWRQHHIAVGGQAVLDAQQAAGSDEVLHRTAVHTRILVS